MTESQRRYYLANKDTPEYKARRRAAVKRYTQRNRAKVAAAQKEQRIRREEALTPHQVAVLSAKAAARHAERMKDPAYREKQRLQSQAHRRAVAADPVRAARAAAVAKARVQAKRASTSTRSPAPTIDRRTVAQVVASSPNSVFALASVALKPAAKHPVGAVAKRRDGGAAPMDADSYKATTWRAPWAAPYALSKRGRSP